MAGGTWVVAVGLLVALPLLTETDPAAELPTAGEAAWWTVAATVTGQAVLVLWRRSAPAPVLVVVAAFAPVSALAGASAAVGVTSVAVLVATAAAVLDLGVNRSLPAVGLAGVLVGAAQVLVQLGTGAGLLAALGAGAVQGAGTVGVPLAAAAVVAARREAGLAREERSRALVREHDALVQVAVARERTATARELHDIAAHHLSGITVMTGALGRQIDTDPEAAKEAVAQVRQQSTAMLRDLRSLVTLLREDGPEGTAPETLASVPALVESARRAGADVGLTVLGPGPGEVLDSRVGALAQFGAYRTVQEALSNAARHAPGARCDVVLDSRDPAMTRVAVVNAPPTGTAERPAASGTGYGLVGMRERAGLTGADLSYGPTDEGGWAVRLVLPTPQDAAVRAPGAGP
ncbi:hypothetical protein GCM10012283_16040 [Phycicoccus endophyticus]|nr:hypothetical protein GCM10012283_16040 [Phycicoccus endophyticus]